MTSTYKGIELAVETKPHGQKEIKVFLDFDLKDTHYQNARVLPLKVPPARLKAAVLALEQWAHTIINDNK